MSVYRLLEELEVEVEGHRLERREQATSSGFARVTTTVVLVGRGKEGHGEDVCYDAVDHERFPELDLRASATLGHYSRFLGGLDLFPPGGSAWKASADYRRWALESAALDLALRQAGVSLGEAIGRPYRPVRFVVSTRLDPRAWLAVDPSLEFKLDPRSEWSREYMQALAATGRIRVLDLKAYYEATAVDQEPDPVLYRTVAELFREAVIEDPWLADGLIEALRGAESRLSFDAPIHSAADVEALLVSPRFLNIKPSRFGTLERLFACLAYCGEREIATYGGGQFELGAGRGQIQALASLFYADAPNDVAPAGYNEAEPRPRLPRSPLVPPERPIGFSWESA